MPILPVLQENIAGAERQRDLVEPLAKKKLVAETELLSIQRELADQQGQLKVYEESVERLKAAVEEAKLLDQGRFDRNSSSRRWPKRHRTLAELSVVEETIRGATDRVKRTDIRSPVDGIVNTLDINTIGAYVDPGSVIAGVVPTADTLLIEARISPRDVAFVRRGQKAVVKVTAYDFSIFGGLEGRGRQYFRRQSGREGKG